MPPTACVLNLLLLAAPAAATATWSSTDDGRQSVDLSLSAWHAQQHLPPSEESSGSGSAATPEPPVVPATVPGDILAALERSDALGIRNESIYFASNLKSASVQAAQNASYWLNTTAVTLSAAFAARGRHTLVVKGLDYNATFYINGERIGSHAGPYRVGELPIRNGLLTGGDGNEVAILFHMPPQGLIGGWLAPGNGVQGVMWNYLDWWKSMVGIGYDFGQPLWGIGVQESLELVATDHALISDLVALPELQAPYEEALVNASVNVDSDVAMQAVVTWTVAQLPGQGEEQQTTAAVAVARTTVSLQVGRTHINSGAALKVQKPALWWPLGSGAQPLYTISVAISAASSSATTSGSGGALDSASRTFGIRDLKQVRNQGPESWTYIEEFYCGPGEHAGAPPDGGANCTFPDALTNLTAEQIDANRNWTFQVNGKKVFAHGANWLPCDMRVSECTTADYNYVLGAAADANMNFIRVWGGGGIEKEAFYDAADRLGIMVYQETMHSQAMPVRDLNFANERLEVEDMINKISSHPSVVRYGWGNEFYGVNHSSNRFERQYEDTANRLDPTRRATHGSPVTWADRHGPYCFYLSDVGKGKAAFPCYQQAAYEAYNSDDAPVMNQEGPNNPMEWDEYGAAGSSSAYTLAQVIPEAVRFPINSSDPDYIFHRAFDAVGPSQMWLTQDAYLPLFGPQTSLEAEVRISQWTQNEGLRYANQAHRRHMPHRSMCAFWTLNEPWPNAAYGSVIDWFGVKKAAYYAATRKVYSHTDVSLTYSNLFLVAGEALPHISPWVVAENSIAGGTLVLNISTTNGTQLHTQTWGVSITVPHNEMGRALELPAPVSWDGPSSDLGGEVVLFSLALVGKAEVLSRQLYTFGILKAGTSAQDNMTAVQPMRPLLEAPAAQCTLSAPTCKQGNSAATTICKSQISNTGSTPCLYMELSLSDPSVPAEVPQFHAASFDDNFVTLSAGEVLAVTFHSPLLSTSVMDTSGGGSALELCVVGWNSAKQCEPIG